MWRCAVSLLSAATMAGCITVEGQSSGEMKQAMLDSFLFRSADIFYPHGVPERAGELPELPRAQQAQIERMYAAVADAIRKEHEAQSAALSRVFGRPVPPTIKARVKVTNTGSPVARIESNGDISVDVRVAQAIYRTALIAGLDDRSIGGANFMRDRPKPSSEAESIGEFLAMKKRVADTAGNTMFGDTVSMVGSLMRDDPRTDFDKSSWFTMADLAMKSSVVERHYSGQMRFLMAHELAHAALGHAEMLRAMGPADCDVIQAIETEADIEATMLFLLETPQASLFDTGFGGDMFGARAAAGFDDFFDYTYDLSGFDAVRGGGCPYPDPKVRKQTVQMVYDKVRKGQADAVLIEAERRANAQRAGSGGAR